MSEELDYVMVESGQAPTLENNLMPNIVHLTEDEATHVNDQLKWLNSTQVYMRLEKDSDND
jgi:hypothetical protein